MRFDTRTLAQAVGRIIPFINPRSAQPVLRGVRLTPQANGVVTLEGTDLEIGAVVAIPALDVGDEPLLVNAADLKRAVASFKGAGAVTIKATSGLAVATDGRRNVGLEVYDLDHYPALPEPDDALVELIENVSLAEILPRLAVAASTDQARPILTSICVDPGDHAVDLVATDSYRMAAYREAALAPIKSQVLWPAKGVVKAVNLTGPVLTCHIGKLRSWFGGDGCLAWVRHIEGAFPKWRTIWPDKSPSVTWSFDRRAEQANLAGISDRDRNALPVRLDLEKMEATVLRGGERVHEAALSGSVAGEAMTMAFNARYLAQGLAILKGMTTKLEAVDSLKAALFTGDDELGYVLMPVRF